MEEKFKHVLLTCALTHQAKNNPPSTATDGVSKNVSFHFDDVRAVSLVEKKKKKKKNISGLSPSGANAIQMKYYFDLYE